MKKLTSFVLLVVVPAVLLGQGRGKPVDNSNCEEYPTKIDSIYRYQWDESVNDWEIFDIWQYSYEEADLTQLLFVQPETRDSIRKWNYYYNQDGNRDLAISQYWRNSSWVLVQKRESEFNSDNQKLNQLTSNWRNDSWVFNNYFYLEYSGDRISKRVFQDQDDNNNLFDVSYNEYSYQGDLLVEITAYDAMNDSILRIYEYNYNEQEKVEEYLILIPDQDGVFNVDFLPYQRRLYSYDEYKLLREVLFQDWNGAEWDTTWKFHYHYKFDKAQKVAICHKGKTLCIAKSAVPAHLRHGDYLGPCSEEDLRNPGKLNDNKVSKTVPYKIYPNPAREKVTIELSGDKDIQYIELRDFYGKLIRQISVDNNTVKIPRKGLRSGNYLIRMVGKETYSTTIIFR